MHIPFICTGILILDFKKCFKKNNKKYRNQILRVKKYTREISFKPLNKSLRKVIVFHVTKLTCSFQGVHLQWLGKLRKSGRGLFQKNKSTSSKQQNKHWARFKGLQKIRWKMKTLTHYKSQILLKDHKTIKQ